MKVENLRKRRGSQMMSLDLKARSNKPQKTISKPLEKTLKLRKKGKPKHWLEKLLKRLSKPKKTKSMMIFFTGPTAKVWIQETMN